MMFRSAFLKSRKVVKNFNLLCLRKKKIKWKLRKILDWYQIKVSCLSRCLNEKIYKPIFCFINHESYFDTYISFYHAKLQNLSELYYSEFIIKILKETMGNCMDQPKREKAQERTEPKKIQKNPKVQQFQVYKQKQKTEQSLECGGKKQKQASYAAKPNQSPNAPKLQAAKWNLEGLRFSKNNESQKAIKCFRKGLQLDPHNFNLYFNLGLELKGIQKTKQAIQCLQKCLEHKQDHYRALRNLGQLLIGTYQMDEALVCLRKAVDLDPENPMAYLTLGIALKKVFKDYQAIINFEKAIELNLKQHTCYLYLGKSYQRTKQLEKAIQCYKNAILLNPKSYQGYSDLGMIYSAMETETEKAIQYLKTAVELKPNIRTYSDYAEALQKGKQFSLALQNYKKCLQLNPKSLQFQAKVKQLQKIKK